MTFEQTLALPQLRYSAAQFTATNPVPADGVLCVETDTDITKTGDGSTAYLSLPRTQLSSDERRSADDLYAVRNGGGTAISVNGVRYDELITVSGALDNSGDFTIDFTNLTQYPGISAASYVSSDQTDQNQVVGMPYVFDLSGFKIAFLNPDGGQLGPEGATVQATFMVKYS